MTRLSFDTLCEMALPGGNPPPVALALRGDGWARLTLGDVPDGIDVSLSNLYPPFFDVYAWLMAIAFDLGPVAVEIDEEGPCTHLYAAPAQDGESWTFAAVQRAWDGTVIAALAWREARAAWVSRLGQACARLFDDFDEAAWIPGPAQWPEAASSLDWQLPARALRFISGWDAGRTRDERRAGFLLWLADCYGPWHGHWLAREETHVAPERHARYEFLFALRMRAVCALAAQYLGLHVAKRHSRVLDRVLDELSGLFEYCEMEREIDAWEGPPELAEEAARVQAFQRLGLALVRAADLYWRAHLAAARLRLGVAFGRGRCEMELKWGQATRSRIVH